jgi:aminoglycoside phosphotransferase family enzyme/predicted kinase
MSESALPPVIRALLDPAAYPHPVDRVKLIQTHVSYVLLAGEHVYKIKKPVDFGFLDFSTLGKRRYYCRQEVILNARLCPGTYLGVSQIRERVSPSASGRSRITVDGAGKVIEYAVRMRRLPDERMMDHLLESGDLTGQMVLALAERLAEFHDRSETSPRIAEYGDWAIRHAWEENLRQWAEYIGDTISEEQDRVIRAYGEAFFAREAELLRQRVSNLRIRDCHGDLRSDAVCFTDDICIYDCIEFNRRMRYTDVAGDVGFLAMDLDYRGHDGVAVDFVNAYVGASGDSDLHRVIDFYKCYRACVRGKVEGFRSRMPEVPPRERRLAARAARRYFELACHYAQSLPPALLVITCGFTATGKSALARRLTELTGIDAISSDVVRKRLAGLAPSDHRFEPFQRGIYTREFTERTYAALLEEARERLHKGRSVILDASFLRRQHRRAAARLAAAEGAQFACLECRASDDAVRKRLDRRLREGADPSDARWEIYASQKRRFQRPSEVSPERLITVDTERPSGREAQRVLRRLRDLSPLALPANG